MEGKILTEQQIQAAIQQLWLTYFNDTLFAKGLITEQQHNQMRIDDYDTHDILAYRLTKPFKLGGSFNGSGVLNYVLTECNTEDTDNFELHIANTSREKGKTVRLMNPAKTAEKHRAVTPPVERRCGSDAA